jgi:hypothetical protein
MYPLIEPPVVHPFVEVLLGHTTPGPQVLSLDQKLSTALAAKPILLRQASGAFCSEVHGNLG